MQWKDIEGYEGLYQVSNTGLIKSLNYLHQQIHKNLSLELNRGYQRVALCTNGIVKRFMVHRLVAKAFCEGYAEGLEVNHIDFNRLNNNALNLEWVTRSQNEKHTYNNGRKLPPCSKIVHNIETGKTYRTITEAAKDNGYKMTTLAAMLRGQNINTSKLIFA